jgi:hypothetical protein
MQPHQWAGREGLDLDEFNSEVTRAARLRANNTPAWSRWRIRSCAAGAAADAHWTSVPKIDTARRNENMPARLSIRARSN